MQVQKGNILVSYPFLEDDYFFRSVISLLDHSEEGSFGLIINKKMPNKIGEVMPLFSNLENYIYVGGPVETSNLFFLHPYKDLKDTIQVSDGLYWNGDIYELRDMFDLEFAEPSQVRFYLGYSGWSEGQLEDEIKEKSWLIGENNLSIVFDNSEDDLIWRKAMETLGKDFENLAHYPIDPHMN